MTFHKETHRFKRRRNCSIAPIRIVYIGFIGIRASRLIDPGSKKEESSCKITSKKR
ncbi:hypothetical protein HanPI659440_Chr15g0583861 [Helianthus annuus]|nr:hypothetical protein HanPI659440_Chr15g0583861 [Helianthus annuus]